jgi:hypothetical protein
MTDDISETLHRAAELLPDSPDRLAGVRRKRASRVRRRAAAATAALALVGAGSAYALTRTATSPDVVSPVTDGGAGDLVASGEVVKVGDGPVKLCAPVPRTLLLILPRPAPRYCDLGVEVRGVDMDAVADRFERDGAISGRAELTGYLDGDVLVVTKQGAPVDEPASPGFDGPPCPAPAGGWPRSNPYGDPDTSALTGYRNAHPDIVAEVAIARPTPSTYGFYVLTYGDPQVVYDALGPTYGDQLCVARSHWTRAQLQSASLEFREHPDEVKDLGVYTWMNDGALQPDGQLVVVASAARANAGLQAIVDRHPKGIIRIDYWLHPVTS